MLKGQQSFTVSTRKAKGQPLVKTGLTINWDGCPIETVQALAVQSLVIKRQGVWRKNGIPASEVILAKDHAPGTRHGESLEATILKLTPEQFAELQRRYEEGKQAQEIEVDSEEEESEEQDA